MKALYAGDPERVAEALGGLLESQAADEPVDREAAWAALLGP